MLARRSLLLAAAAAPPQPSFAPADERLLNAFAADYNAYVEQLRAGTVDLKMWRRVEKAWRKLHGD